MDPVRSAAEVRRRRAAGSGGAANSVVRVRDSRALSEIDLDSAEGRVSALRRCVPIVAQIKDPTLRDEYARQLAGWVGWADVAQVIGRVREEAKNPTSQGRAPQAPSRAAAARPKAAPDLPRLVPTPATRRCGRSARRSSRRCSTRRWPARCSTR